jgi:hypothetical protein
VDEWRSLAAQSKVAITRTRDELKREGAEEALLNCCCLGDAGSFVFAEVIQTLGKNLRLLSLQSNNIGDEGAIEVASALKMCGGPLQTVNLAVNKVGDGGALAFAGLLEDNPSLKMVNLDSNCVTDIGAKGLVAALAKRGCYQNATCVLTDNPVRRFSRKSLENLALSAETVNYLARQGVTLGQLLTLYTDSVATGKITPETTTSEVVQSLVLPASKGGMCSYIDAMAAKPGGKVNPLPIAQVIHAWDGRFVDLVRCIANHACGKPPGKRDPNLDLDPKSIQWRYNPEWTGKSYFVDAFCINQHTHRPARALGQFARFANMPAWNVGDPGCEIDKLHLVANRIQQKKGRLVVVVDSQRSVLTRVQCLYEVFAGLQQADALASNIDVLFTALSSFPPEKRKTLVQDSGATDEKMRSVILSEIEHNPGGFDDFNSTVLELIDRHADTELHALLG